MSKTINDVIEEYFGQETCQWHAKVLVKKLVNGMQPQVLWTDEKLFTVQAVHNHQNDRIWLPDINMVPVERRSSFRRQKPASVMVWAGQHQKG